MTILIAFSSIDLNHTLYSSSDSKPKIKLDFYLYFYIIHKSFLIL